jgi:SAM-dependent methyltransferase
MSQRPSFDPYARDYYQRLDRCLRGLGGRDALYYNRLKFRWLMRLAPKYLPDLGRADFLDLGCGAGLTVAAAAPSFRFGAGLDQSPEMIKAGLPPQPNTALLVGDATRLPFPAQSLDLVFSATFLHHLADHDLAVLMAESRRVLRPGGLLIHFDHNPYNILTRQVVRFCEFDEQLAIMRPLRAIARLTAAAGFTVRETGYLAFIPAFASVLEPLEPWLRWLPLGAQYFLAATAGP